MTTRMFGERVERQEDDRLLAGKGRYTDDFELDGRARGVRPLPARARAHHRHRRQRRARRRRRPRRLHVRGPRRQVRRAAAADHPARGDRRRTDPVRAGARRGALRRRDDRDGRRARPLHRRGRRRARSSCDYEPLPVVADIELAAAPDAPAVHTDRADNVVARVAEEHGDVDAGFARPTHTFEWRFDIERSAATPLEGARASSPASDDATAACSCTTRRRRRPASATASAALFDLDLDQRPRRRARRRRRLRREGHPVLSRGGAGPARRPPARHGRSSGPRTAASTSSAPTHEREQVHHVRVGCRRRRQDPRARDELPARQRRLLPVRADHPDDHRRPAAGAVPARQLPLRLHARCSPTGADLALPRRRPPARRVRDGAGDGPLAVELKHRPRRDPPPQPIQPDEFPYDVGVTFQDGGPTVYDSGDYPTGLDVLLEAVDYAGFEARREAAAPRGGGSASGIAGYVEGTGIGPYEGAAVNVQVDGTVTVATGLSSQGQGHQTVLRPDRAPTSSACRSSASASRPATRAGSATASARSPAAPRSSSGNAVHKAAVDGAARRRPSWPRALLEADPEDLEFDDGRVGVIGSPGRRVCRSASSPRSPTRCATRSARSRPRRRCSPAACTPRRRCRCPTGTTPGLNATEYYSPRVRRVRLRHARGRWWRSTRRPATCRSCATSSATTAARVINPMIVEGQMYGGVAQGIGGALYERMAYDEDGQLLNASFMDFLMPYATELPEPALLPHRDAVAEQRARRQGRGRGRDDPGRRRDRQRDLRRDRTAGRQDADLAVGAVRAPARRVIRIGIDTGGTFTDVVAVDADGRAVSTKVPSTPGDPSVAFMRGDREGERRTRSPRSCTARRWPPTRCSRTTSAASGSSPPRGSAACWRSAARACPTATATRTSGSSPIASCRCTSCRRCSERLDHAGAVVREFDEEGARAVARWFREQGIDCVGVCFLHSYMNPDARAPHARRAGRRAPRLRRVAELRRAERVPRVRAVRDHARRRVRQAARRPSTPARSRPASAGRSTS